MEPTNLALVNPDPSKEDLKEKIIKAAVVDSGTSINKTLCAYRNVVHFFPMPAFVAPLNQSLYQEALALSENRTYSIWAGCTGYKVGLGAATQYQQVDTSMKKTDVALAKVLASIGQIKAKLSPDRDMKITRLLVLLPYVELAGSSVLIDAIRDAIQGFEFNGKHLRITIDKILVKYEGFGLSTISTEESVSFGVFGQKDLTIGAMQNGTLVRPFPKVMVGKGMHRVIEQVEYTFRSHVTAAQIIAQYAIKGNPKNPERSRAAQAKILKQYLPEADIERVSQSIDQAIENTWFEYEQEFTSNPVVKDSAVMYVTGGSSVIWRNQLKDFNTKCGRKLQLLSAQSKDIAAALNMHGDPMTFRVADAWLALYWLNTSWGVK